MTLQTFCVLNPTFGISVPTSAQMLLCSVQTCRVGVSARVYNVRSAMHVKEHVPHPWNHRWSSTHDVGSHWVKVPD